MFKRIATILEMIKFGHAIFALPFVLLAGFLAERGVPAWDKLGLIVACAILARNVAMTYNRLIDAPIDKLNPRTASRAIPQGLISRKWALGFIGINMAGFIAVCSLFYVSYDNILPIIFAVPVLVYLCGYSHLKRLTWFCHFWLGGAHALAVLAGFIAIDPRSLGIGAAALAGAVGAWTAGFDIIYSTLDAGFDRAYDLHSLPAKLGIAKALILSQILHGISIVGFGVAGFFLGLGWLFGMGVAMTAILLVWEHRMVRPNDLSRVNTAFFAVNGSISLMMGFMGLLDVVLLRGFQPWN